ncbi:polysaccharide deacetylase family protein [Defluviicoccus vanus]|uniref:Chitooligosaccharide deacetylase n=1 Tax=Defluviicoccus vanus TaxID=111831 RepID=A0A7H1N3L2_9PROT|nr:polysaccharide deacetylase family protein [Defluviicoccus vanus]QNT70298.1 polysaccharide deacetylase family protein [Defluviicoccus vanus]
MRKRDQSPFGKRGSSAAKRPGSSRVSGNQARGKPGKGGSGPLLTRRRLIGGLAAGVVIALAVRTGQLPHHAAKSRPRAVPRAVAKEPEAEVAVPAAEPQGNADRRAKSFGSAAVLTALWTTDELRSQPNEARIVRLRPADHTPPDRASLRQPLPPLSPPFTGSIRRVKTENDEKLVALTFDLCERADDVAGYEGGIVDILREGRVPATFYAGGKWLRSHAERALQLIADPLFEVGNHGWTHGNMRVLEGEAAEQQVVWTMAEYEILRERLAARAEAKGVDAEEIARIPLSTRTFRFPYGTCSEATLAMVGRLGLPAIQWDVISGDAVKGQSPETVRRSVLDQVKPGSIVVFHGNGRGSGTVAALPAIVRELAHRGYRFVNVSYLLGAGQPVAYGECYELRPGDNQRYDRLFGAGTG